MGDWDQVLTSSLFWYSALVVASIDVVVVALLVRYLSDRDFRRLGPPIAIASIVFWSVLWTTMILVFWDEFYSYVFPLWIRRFPPVLGLAYGAVGLLLWWLATRLSRHTVTVFCLLGGVEGLATHIWAVYGLGALSEPPMMRSVSAASVLSFAFFEKVLYWSAVLGNAILMWRFGRSLSKVLRLALSRLRVTVHRIFGVA